MKTLKNKLDVEKLFMVKKFNLHFLTKKLSGKSETLHVVYGSYSNAVFKILLIPTGTSVVILKKLVFASFIQFLMVARIKNNYCNSSHQVSACSESFCFPVKVIINKTSRTEMLIKAMIIFSFGKIQMKACF